MAQTIQLDNGDHIETAVSLDDISLGIYESKLSTSSLSLEGTYNPGQADEYVGVIYIDPNKITVYY